MVLHTRRLTLLNLSREILEASMKGQAELSRALGGADIDPDWPPEELVGIDEAFLGVLKTRGGEVARWLGWYWVHQEARVLVGLGGFKGPVAEGGMVEVGYNVVGRWQGQGIATEAVGALCGWALGQEGVRWVRAHVEPENVASVRVLEKVGFERCEGVFEEASAVGVALWRYRLGEGGR